MEIAGLAVGVIVGQVLLEKLNNLDLKFINSIHNATKKLKHKTIFQYTLMLIVGVLIFGFMGKQQVSTMLQGLIVGGLWAIIAFCFENTLFDSMRNTLR